MSIPSLLVVIVRWLASIVTQRRQPLCRWLLLSLDGLPGNELVITQQLKSNVLGVSRKGVTEAALALQTTGLIHIVRGRCSVLDRPS